MLKKPAILASTLLAACFATNASALNGVSMDNVGTISSGFGTGDMILAAVSGDKSQSLVWDLSFMSPGAGDPGADLTYADLTSWAGANPGGMFTIANATVGATIDSSWQWHVFGLTNITENFGLNVVSVGAATTVDNVGSLPSGTTLGMGMNNVTSWVISQNVGNGGLTDDGVATAIGTDTWFWDNTQGNGQAALHGNNLFGIDVTGNVGETLDVALLLKQPGSLFTVDSLTTEISELGTFLLDDGGNLTFTAAAPVPVPAAVWLFGSALAGFFGYGRRKSSVRS